MQVYSLRKESFQLKPLIVEVSLVPGVPSIQILGLPDQSIKESAVRIRSAFKALGIAMPKGSQVIVNLRPSDIKKRSRGLEFAIAAALLWELGYIEKPSCTPLLYGELSLSGEVEAPDDLEDLLKLPDNVELWVGRLTRQVPLPWTLKQVACLSDLSQPEVVEMRTDQRLCSSPSEDLNFETMVFPKDLADTIAVIALGEHPTLFAGPQGCGKTTMARIIHYLLTPIPNESFRLVRSIHRLDGRDIHSRPLISPHHTTSPVSMVGGGASARPGDITRAHGGVLLLDEYLEFSTRVQEALREPFESGMVTVSKNLRSFQHPARALILATTNLCPCGKWVPGSPMGCSHSMRKCRSTVEKLSGPMLDRFAICKFIKRSKSQATTGLSEIRQRLQSAREFQKKYRSQEFANQRLNESDLVQGIDETMLDYVRPKSSRRRSQSLFRVARTLADLDLSPNIESRHLSKAVDLTVQPFNDLVPSSEW